ncbi:MAG TPA: hypothetical protein VGP76_15605 [Planctomycetaceae bacterium]|jgi:hypothetical protein|nr:hypothetical protein [Planctomycetaceae bacterium]
MIEIRTYDGDPEELAVFCTNVWRTRYGGQMPVWLWTGPFFNWELFSQEPGARDFLVAAYDGTRLIGAHPAKPVHYHWQGEPVFGTAGAYFSVDPEYQSQSVSLKLVLEQRRRHRERDALFDMGYLIMGAQTAMGKDFWLRLKTMQVVAKLSLWTRMIDHRALTEFSISARDRWGSKLMGLVQGRPKPPADPARVRPYRDADLHDCLELAGELSRAADFGIAWDEVSLARQLAFPNVPRTLVFEFDGRVRGFLNFSKQPFWGRREILVGMIDLLCVQRLNARQTRDLLSAALVEIAEAGCHVATLLGTQGVPIGSLLRTGFIEELPPDYLYVAQAMTPDARSLKTKSLHAIMR